MDTLQTNTSWSSPPTATNHKIRIGLSDPSTTERIKRIADNSMNAPTSSTHLGQSLI